MLKIIDIETSNIWDNIVKSFDSYDVYYLSGYVKAFQIHGDGEPQLLYFEDNGLRAIYVYMKRYTSIDGLFDSITPYGYGGVLFEGNTNEDNLRQFWAEYISKMEEINIVDNFVRYHPILANAQPMKQISEVIDLGKTIALDLSSPEVIWENIDGKSRNKIRKAEKNGIKIDHSKDFNLFEKFIQIYNATMDKCRELVKIQKDILVKRYGLYGSKEYTQKEIAKYLGISRSYVSRIEKRALIKLLREFYKDKNNSI